MPGRAFAGGRVHSVYPFVMLLIVQLILQVLLEFLRSSVDGSSGGGGGGGGDDSGDGDGAPAHFGSASKPLDGYSVATCVAVLSDGPIGPRLRMCFEAFDEDSAGVLQPPQLVRLLQARERDSAIPPRSPAQIARRVSRRIPRRMSRRLSTGRISSSLQVSPR